MIKKKILAFTAIRSEYDLLSSLYKLLNDSSDIELKLVVSGAHLSKSYGYSVEDILSDGFSILLKIETLLDSDSKMARLKSGSILLLNSIDVIANYNPDIIMYAGDREETLIGAMIGGYLEIPTIHFFGGDHVKDSHIDNPVRHATSKLSTIHMVSNEDHRLRLIKMGEKKERIFNIGSIALDKFQNFHSISMNEIKEYFQIKHNFNKFAILIFHPIPMERNLCQEIFENILLSLKMKKINAFVSYPNIDPGNRQIISVIEKYKDDHNFIFYKNLPRDVFISIYKNSQFIIGNSSSGILESASIPIPAINVGYRQTGRKANKNVLFSGITKQEISNAIEKAFSKEFKKILRFTKNIYGDGKSSLRAFTIIKKNDFRNLLYKDEDILEIIHE
ncbi:MAG: UDP-N-acetylglucosamine 2-epimerase [Spirochaetia bacterium]|nr:UDP-N-acetylglucosamine 2-epimerase [Spirochaetia bacterium]